MANNIQCLDFLIRGPTWKVLDIETDDLVKTRHSIGLGWQWHMWADLTLAQITVEFASKVNCLLAGLSMFQQANQVVHGWMTKVPVQPIEDLLDLVIGNIAT